MYKSCSCFFSLSSGLAESLFSSHREDYVEIEQASLTQLFQYKVFDSLVEGFFLENMSVFGSVHGNILVHSWNNISVSIKIA